MKLEDLLKMIDVYQDIQLVNAKTGEVYTDVTYLAGGSTDNIDNINNHKTDLVHGISAGISDGGQPYVRISIDCVI